MQSFGIGNAVIDTDVQPVVLHDNMVAPLSDLIPAAPTRFQDLFAEWDGLVEEIGQALSSREDIAWRAQGEIVFEVPGVDRPSVYCSGANYHDHIAEMGAPSAGAPFHFISPSGVLNAHKSSVHRPIGASKLDWEVELAVVIGRKARNVPRDEALDYIAGYTVANDVSARDEAMFHSLFGVDWMFAKNAEGLTPIGPVIVPACFVPAPEKLSLSLTVNGVTRQNSSTSQLIVGIAQQIELLSSYLTLNPGDVILTGTPAGTAAGHGRAYLNDGDVMVARIESVGELENTIAG
jgi:2-keto-4-pentenoate hydratase/2-oxohepta-3-ene-1,7-dioic acid hydratase in catechol pathway